MGFTPPEQRARPTNSPQSSASLLRRAAAIGCLALTLFAFGLFDDSFVDEYAYITQSYYADLFFRRPIQSSRLARLVRLRPSARSEVFDRGRVCGWPTCESPVPPTRGSWYFEHYTPFGNQATLIVARIPILFLGALGCVALFGCGVLIEDRRVGTIAAILLMINPLYRLHAHRAMSDVPYEAFLISALGLGLYALQRFWSGRPGIAALWFSSSWRESPPGSSILCKFNGLLGLDGHRLLGRIRIDRTGPRAVDESWRWPLPRW